MKGLVNAADELITPVNGSCYGALLFPRKEAFGRGSRKRTVVTSFDHGDFQIAADAVVQGQATAHVGHSDAVAPFLRGFTKGAGIRNGNKDGIGVFFNTQAHESVPIEAGNTMFNGVFDQRLDGQDRNLRLKHRFIDIELRTKLRSEAQFLDPRDKRAQSGSLPKAGSGPS